MVWAILPDDWDRNFGEVKTSEATSSFFVLLKTVLTQRILPNALSYSPLATPRAVFDELNGLISTGAFQCVLVHYGSYAYSPTGQPRDFVDRLVELSNRIHLIVFFHEVYATGMPWTRAFWTNRQQRLSARKLVNAADVAFTSNLRYQRELEALNAKGHNIIKIPIFSNIGEPTQPPLLRDRARQLVIFGQLNTRLRLYRNNREMLQTVCEKLHIESVLDVGPGNSPDIPKMLSQCPVKGGGWMEEENLSRLLSNCIAGVVEYNPNVWEKSGVMAAYEAHRLVPMLVELEPQTIFSRSSLPYVLAENIANGHEFSSTFDDSELQKIADAAFHYYHQYQSVEQCSKVIAANLASHAQVGSDIPPVAK